MTKTMHIQSSQWEGWVTKQPDGSYTFETENDSHALMRHGLQRRIRKLNPTDENDRLRIEMYEAWLGGNGGQRNDHQR